jgi:hypothetical protein
MRYMRGIAEVNNGMVQADPLEDDPSHEEVYERVLFGTPDEVSEKLRLDLEATGADLVNCYFGPGRISNAKTLESMRLFALEVMPRFAGQAVGAAR